MTRCIIHIGIHKTGSTSIQHSLRGFSDNRFLYARLGDTPNHSVAVYSLFAPHPELHRIHRNNGADAAALSAYIEKVRGDLEQAVSAARGRTLVISGEGISGLPLDGLIKLRDYLQERLEDLKLVGYVRSPAALMSSTFQHRVRVGWMDRADPKRQYRSYERTFGKFDQVFGRDRVNLWKFDPGSFLEGCVVRDFCSRTGIELPSERITRLNESLPQQAVALLYTYRKLRPDDARTMTGPERAKLVSRLALIGNDRFRLSPELIKPILDKYRADIDWMEARLGQSLHEELGEHRPGDVRDESDLLLASVTATSKLLALLANSAPIGVAGKTAEEVARFVHALRVAEVEDLSIVGKGNGVVLPGECGDLVNGAFRRQTPGSKRTLSRSWAAAVLRNWFRYK